MAPFEVIAGLKNELDFRLVSDSFVTLFWSRSVLKDTTEWLLDHGYLVVWIDTSGWRDDADMHRDFADGMEFPKHYDESFDGLNDCLGDVVAYEYGSDPEATGLVLVLLGYDGFLGASPESSRTLLDIFARQAREGALIGHRMMCLVQSDDPYLEIGTIGASPVWWNDAEWHSTKRGVIAPRVGV
ncbi:MAG: barstar family protein [Actinomycetes bacterium]